MRLQQKALHREKTEHGYSIMLYEHRQNILYNCQSMRSVEKNIKLLQQK
jgi:hypothetical protein